MDESKIKRAKLLQGTKHTKPVLPSPGFEEGILFLSRSLKFSGGNFNICVRGTPTAETQRYAFASITQHYQRHVETREWCWKPLPLEAYLQIVMIMLTVSRDTADLLAKIS